MRWALLGADEESRSQTRTILSANAPQLDLITVPPTEWEGLLAREDVDAVVVVLGIQEFLRDELLKKLVGGGIVVVAVHPATDVLTAYEIEVIRREVNGTIVAFAPGWQHPAWDLLSELVSLGDSSPLGRTEQVSFERHVSSRQRSAVLAQFSQDVRVLRRLLGNITSVNAVGVTRSDDSWTSLSVHFASDQGRAATWSMVPPNSPAETRVTISGIQATAKLVISGSPGNESWELHDSVGYRELFPPWNDAASLVAQLELATSGGEPTPSWPDSCLDLEIAESAEQSLRRKRAIDLHTTERSEEKTFKGVMAAAGCLVLAAILIVFLGLALWDGFRAPFRDSIATRATEMEASGPIPPEAREDPQQRSAKEKERPGWPLWARLWPVYPVFAFLLLQFLLLITRRTPDDIASGAGK